LAQDLRDGGRRQMSATDAVHLFAQWPVARALDRPRRSGGPDTSTLAVLDSGEILIRQADSLSLEHPSGATRN
jgi:hypothetical protein